MTLQAVPAYISLGGFNHPTELDRNMLKAVFGRTGVNRVGDFAVTPTGVNQQVSIAAGSAFLLGVESNTQGGYFVWNNAAETQTFGVPSGSARIDALLLSVEDPQYGSIPGSPLATWRLIAGVPSGSPAARPDSDFNTGGSFYIPGAWFRVADVRINVGDTVIPGGQITSNLRYTRTGGICVCTSTTRPTDPVLGDRIYETDTKFRRYWDGSAWAQDGTWSVTQTLGSNAASITFSSIPTTLHTLRVTWSARSSDATLARNLLMRVNGDSGANYSGNFQSIQNVTSAGTTDSAVTRVNLGIIPGSTATANDMGNGSVHIPGWSRSGIRLGLTYQNHFYDSAANSWNIHGGYIYVGAGPYTSLTFLADIGNLITGTTIRVEGWE